MKTEVPSLFPAFFYILLQVIARVSSASLSLYELDDPLWQLDTENFNRIVYGKSNAFIIEFYASWCGHCIRFAPKWQEFSRDIENWKNVIEVGVVNCADPDGTSICRNYDVTSYPTIKLFHAFHDGTDKGHRFMKNNDLSPMREQIIDFLQSRQNAPSQWPDLNDVKAGTLSEFWNTLPSDVNTAYIVVEHNDSYIGREVILDLSSQKDFTVRRVSDINTPLSRELVEELMNSNLAVFVELNRDGGKEIINVFDDSFNDTQIRDTIFETLTGKSRVKAARTGGDKEDPNDLTIKDGVYMADLENAVRYALEQEVGVQSYIAGEQFTVLKNFIDALRKYFPGSPAVEGYLIKLNSWMDQRKGNLTGERFANALDNLQTKTAYLPKMHDYVGCKGSKSKYRGYPCSLWTLFHTLTVQAYRAYEKSEGESQPQKILHDIKGYVKHFFSCRGCSAHFQKMSENLTEEAKTPKDAVLWLWQTHNIVNKRLSGDATEDPRHLKIQFPSQEACPKCRLQTEGDAIEWDRNAVMLYLQNFYKREKIIPVNNDATRPEDGQTDSGNMLHRSQKYSFIVSFLPLLRYMTNA